METSEILLRASGIGALATDKQGAVITENQLEKIEYLQDKIREGKSLTANQQKELQALKEKRDNPFELSDTAKRFVEEIWLRLQKGFVDQVKSKYTDKGIFGEEDSISLLSKVDGRFYQKNDERITKGNITGECDIFWEEGGVKYVDDVKSCWSPKTFMSSDLDKLYEWQGRAYLHLYDADVFRLRYCLEDCPEHLVKKEKERIWYKYYSNSMSDTEADKLEKSLEPLFLQIERNLIFSTSGKYTEKERVKTFIVQRDDDLFKEKILDRIPYAVEYYKSITLNQIN